MNLRTSFLLCFSAACLPAVGWSGWIAVHAQAEWAQARAAVRMARAMGDALQLVEALSVERGALQERALLEGPGAENLAEVGARNDALLDRTQASLIAAGLPDEAVVQARAMLLDARARIAEAVRHPVAERDPDLVPSMVAQLFERLDAVERAVARAERGAAHANAAVGNLLAVGSLAVEMRSAAGRRSTYLSGWMGGLAITPEQHDRSMLMTGQMQHAWERLQRQVLIVDSPPRLTAAVEATRSGFWQEAEPRYRQILAIAHVGSERPMPLVAWRRWTIAALRQTLLARDAAVAEAVAHGSAVAAKAEQHMAVAGAATLGLILLAGGAVLVLLRRLVLPVQRLTATVTRLAGGDVAAEVPERHRPDEIGAMAAAIEVFRGNAVALQQTNLRFDAALSNMSQGLAMFDARERLIVVNARMAAITGLAPDQLRPGMTFSEIIGMDPLADASSRQTLAALHAEHRALAAARDTAVAYERVRGNAILAVSLRPLPQGGWLLTLEDITERRRNEKRIEHMAHHDALTGLPNRVLFQMRLAEALVRARRGERFSLLSLDVDRFKAINDAFGCPVGDAVLQAATARLSAELRETDVIGRLGGDEFAILQAMTGQPQQAASLAQRLIGAMDQPFIIDGQGLDISVSIGIAVVSGDGETVDSVLKKADLALHRAKLDGRGMWRFFEPDMDARMQYQRRLERDLRQALAAGQLEMHYQPVMDLRSRRVTGLEALLRWRHPEQGLIPPSDFVPLAEEAGLIGAIGRWGLRRACADAAGWPERISIAVNVSAVQFRTGAALVDQVRATLRETGLPAARLVIEVTETAILQDTEETLAALHALQALGVEIALDDFGTGYSSLSHLRRFPFDRVKIDRTFVQCLDRTENDSAAIVRAVIDLCAGLDITVTVEGIETEEQLDWLAAQPPVEAQGYLFSRAMPAEAVPDLIATLTYPPLPYPPRAAGVAA